MGWLGYANGSAEGNIMAVRSGRPLLVPNWFCRLNWGCCMLLVLESGVPAVVRSEGDMSSWKLCRKLGFESVFIWNPLSPRACLGRL